MYVCACIAMCACLPAYISSSTHSEALVAICDMNVSTESRSGSQGSKCPYNLPISKDALLDQIPARLLRLLQGPSVHFLAKSNLRKNPAETV